MSSMRPGHFDVDDGVWADYMEKMQDYFQREEVSEDNKVPTLIYMMGDVAHDLLKKLAGDKKVKDLSIRQVNKLMEEHSKSNILTVRYNFRRRMQRPEENVLAYCDQLKMMARKCKFGSGLDENVRDQFLFGLKNNTIRRKLLADSEHLDITKALSTAEWYENAVPYDVVPDSTPSTSRADLNDRPIRQCVTCGKTGHTNSYCWKNKNCKRCGAKGHLEQYCPKRKRTGSP